MTDQPTKTRPEDQALPVGGQECVQDALIALIEDRKQLGIQRYGSPLMTHNGRDAGRDMVEEAVDLAVYSMQVAMELRDLRAAVAELAQAIRLTREYVGEELLPPVAGWSWYDALRRHAPHELAAPVDDEPVDTCRTVEVDDESIRARGTAELSEVGQEALTELVRAARRRMINEQRAAMAKYPYDDGDVTVLGPETFVDASGKVISWKGENYVPQNRLRLAHEARRRKEGQLDGIRRALCDVGLMEDDDPYGHADLEDVIRQALRVGCPDPIECGHEAALGVAEEALTRVREIANTWVQDGEPGPTQAAGRCLPHALGDLKEQPASAHHPRRHPAP